MGNEYAEHIIYVRILTIASVSLVQPAIECPSLQPQDFVQHFVGKVFIIPLAGVFISSGVVVCGENGRT